MGNIMDKTMFKGYVRELVREAVKEEVKRILPELLDEAVGQVKAIQESAGGTSVQKPKLDRKKLAEMMGLERHGDTIMATTSTMPSGFQTNLPSDNPTVQAITKDYSALMKKMGLTK